MGRFKEYTTKEGGLFEPTHYKTTIKALVLLFLTLLCQPSFAFDVNGFSSFMPEEQALKIFRSRVDRILPVPLTESKKTGYLGTRSDFDLTEAIIFCNGKLISYQYDVRGGFPAFIRLVEKETLLRDRGEYEANIHQTQVGEWISLKFFWKIDTERKSIGISIVSSQKEQVYVEYSTETACQ